MKIKSFATTVLCVGFMLLPLANAVADEAVIHNNVEVHSQTTNTAHTSQNGSARAEVQVKTVINGETVTDIHKTATGSDASVSVNKTTQTNQNTQPNANQEELSAQQTAVEKPKMPSSAQIRQLASALNQLLTHFPAYVFSQ